MHLNDTTPPRTCLCGCGEIVSKGHSFKRNHQWRLVPLEQRFWKLVQKTENCWNWIGTRTSRQYGAFYDKAPHRKLILAHRFSYESHYGPIPEGMVVCHKCDNPLCVNPDHLFLGTQQDNMNDMVSKGRQLRGEANGFAKTTAQTVTTIRTLYASGQYTIQQLAETYHLSPTHTHRIIKRLVWKHLP